MSRTPISDTDDSTALVDRLVAALAAVILAAAPDTYAIIPPGQPLHAQRAKLTTDTAREARADVEQRIYELCEELRETRGKLDAAEDRAQAEHGRAELFAEQLAARTQSADALLGGFTKLARQVTEPEQIEAEGVLIRAYDATMEEIKARGGETPAQLRARLDGELGA